MLRHTQTGVLAYFSTFHNPANIGGNMQRYRDARAGDRALDLAREEAAGSAKIGTTGRGLRLEAFELRLTGSEGSGARLQPR